MITDFFPVTTCPHTISEVDENDNIILINIEGNCTICQNIDNYFSYQFNDIGDSILLTSSDKPRVDIYKLLGTKRGDNKFQPNYGLTVEDLIGEKLLTPSINRTRNEVIGSIDYLLSMQEEPTYFPYAESEQIIENALTSDVQQINETALSIQVIFELQNGVITTTKATVGS